MTTNYSYLERFRRGLSSRGYDPDDVMKNWRYYGGDYGEHYNYLRLLGGHKRRKEDRCVCGQYIKRNCYIEKDNDVIVIGNCCIKRFMKKSGRTCSVCEAPHINRKYNFCNMCKNPEYRCKYIYEQVFKRNFKHI